MADYIIGKNPNSRITVQDLNDDGVYDAKVDKIIAHNGNGEDVIIASRKDYFKNANQDLVDEALREIGYVDHRPFAVATFLNRASKHKGLAYLEKASFTEEEKRDLKWLSTISARFNQFRQIAELGGQDCKPELFYMKDSAAAIFESSSHPKIIELSRSLDKQFDGIRLYLNQWNCIKLRPNPIPYTPNAPAVRGEAGRTPPPAVRGEAGQRPMPKSESKKGGRKGLMKLDLSKVPDGRPDISKVPDGRPDLENVPD